MGHFTHITNPQKQGNTYTVLPLWGKNHTAISVIKNAIGLAKSLGGMDKPEVEVVLHSIRVKVNEDSVAEYIHRDWALAFNGKRSKMVMVGPHSRHLRVV